MDEQMINKDHDILIEIKTKVEMLVTTVENMRNDLHSRVDCLETTKVDKEDLGKVIGKQGKTAAAMRTIIRAAGTKLNKRYHLDIVE